MISMFLAVTLLMTHGQAAAQEYSEAAHAVQDTSSSLFLNRAQEEQNKAIVRRVYDEIFGQGNTAPVNDLFSEVYIQHNPSIPKWRPAFIAFVHFLISLNPPP